LALAPGTRLGSYEVVAPLGAGGMGEVYRARHLKLGREAAIKVLPAELASDLERLRRLEREARAASALNHPAIVTIYDVDEDAGTRYIAMELVEGVTLRARLRDGPLPVQEALRLAAGIAEGLARAHEAGIVHRDLKPDNVMITRDGHPKLLDFGLAKQVASADQAESELATVSRTTRAGVVLGTVPYMSPEQAAGRPVDHTSDQFAFGVMLFEMLCGRRPFLGDSVAAVLGAILRDPPPPLRSIRPEAPRSVATVVDRCLAKDKARRYPSTAELRDALHACQDSMRPRGALLGGRTLAAAIGVLAFLAAALASVAFRAELARWWERDTLAEIDRLAEAGTLYDAFSLAHRLRGTLRDDPELRRRIERITLPVSIVTVPADAEVRIRAYAAAPDADWVLLGRTPLQGVRVPYALTQWKITKPGFAPFEGAPFGARPLTAFARGWTLEAEGARPPEMVRVPGGRYERLGYEPVSLGEDYWIDRHEVTNRRFKEFLDAGGYEKPEYWSEPFVSEGRSVPRAEAMRGLVDKTGRPGPAGWEFGAYDDGEAEYPVGGVSWYEAAAYCGSVGKALPTLFHWSAATGQDQFSDIVRVSNFGRAGPAPVGTHPGLGDFGTYDMAGNVKEWVWNEVSGGPGRYILGGSWEEPSYMFRINTDARPPLARDASHGFRCARYASPPSAALLGPLKPTRLLPGATPVSDEVFEAYRRMYGYDRTPLDASIDSVDDSSPHWRRQTVSFDAAYGDERVVAHVFLPRNAQPPFQPVIWVPGNDVFFLTSGEALASPYLFDFVPRSGRALVYPVYKGTYERRVAFSFAPNEWRDVIVWWSKDLSRTIDYLEQRPDMDAARLGYYGFSSGAIYGPIFTSVDGRFKASVLLAAGLVSGFLPEVSVANFAPRSRVPTLMINGRDDFITPYEISERPLFRLLAAPEADKRHVRLAGGHLPASRGELIAEVLSWFDSYLGPVAGGGAASPAAPN
jgi:formylglycine-generating enzyme required for sulfatase activity